MLIIKEIRSQTGPERHPRTEEGHQEDASTPKVSSALGQDDLVEAEAMENIQ